MNEYILSKAQIDFLATWFTRGYDEAVRGTPPDRDYTVEELGLCYRHPEDPWTVKDERFLRLSRTKESEMHVSYSVQARWTVDESWSPVGEVHLESSGKHYQFVPNDVWTTLRPEWFALERRCITRLAHRLQGSGHTGGKWGEVLHRYCVELLKSREFPIDYPIA